jgi:predicted lipoprotein with Yx(FWY)xxD motif
MLCRVINFDEENIVANKSKSLATLAAVSASLALVSAILAGCGGGAYGASSSMYPTPGNTATPTPQQVPLQTAMLKGAPGFINSASRTVYVFDADLQSPGNSVCNDQCAMNWPPLIAPSGNLPSPYSAVVRQDGRHQLAYQGRPLYTFVGDGAPGQTNGDGLDAFGGLWHIARP